MYTLDVLDYLTRLEDALAEPASSGPRAGKPRLGKVERKMASREVKRAVEDLAFRFAFLDERALPEDLDWARALEALKDPRKAADAIAKREPEYRRRRVRKQLTTLAAWALVLGVVGAFFQIASLEKGEIVLTVDRAFGSPGEPESFSASYNVSVPEDATRLRFSSVVVVREGTVRMSVLGPANEVRFQGEFDPRSGTYETPTFEAPAPGAWTVVLDGNDARGSLHLEVLLATRR